MKTSPAFSRWQSLLADPLFLGACGLYALNRWLLRPFVPGLPGFFHAHFNDVLLLPAGLPVLTGIHVLTRLRVDWRPPTPPEVLAHLALWTALCEWIGPTWLHKGTGDPLDALAYAAGALVAGVWWWFRTKRLQ